MGDLGECGGLKGMRVPTTSLSSSSSLDLVGLHADKVGEEIIQHIRPTCVSEERRNSVVSFVQTLLQNHLACQVFPFGSVPLKTYLPDGDIDLTVFCGFNMEESFAKDVHSVLEREEHNAVAEFVVKDVQYIQAEVKLVKCLIQNIVVDISFNQIGGLCALCFLEEVDRFIGKNHLFKRSIILIKAWCYYESRILGAYHGLISTYALEMLVLYIFHLFHSSLSNPLSVLNKFLEYFSKFDWEHYCVSLNGPVCVSSLPKIVAEKPDNGGGDLLLSHDFMRECVQKFSVPSRGIETNAKKFMRKHFNIVDPLKENNNLGRSVSRGNFFRIRSAFAYGARQLGQILLQSKEDIASEVRRYFANTLARHGQGQRPDVHDIRQMPHCNGFVSQFHLRNHKVESFISNGQSGEFHLDSKDTGHGGDLDKLVNGIQDNRTTNDPDKSSLSPLGYGPFEHYYYYFPRRREYGKAQNGYLYGRHETPSLLPDLSGDMDCHLDGLQYGQWWYASGNMLTSSNQSVHLAPPPLFKRKTQWDVIQELFGQETVPLVSANCVSPRPPFFPLSPQQLMGGVPVGIDAMPKTRGTGTFFPVMEHLSYQDRFKGRSRGQSKSHRTNGRTPASVDRSPHVQSPVSPGMWKFRSSDTFENSVKVRVSEETKDFVVTSDKVELSSLVPPPLETLLPVTENNRATDSSSPGSQSGESLLVPNSNRLDVQSYHLKDNAEFPPLSS